MPGVPGAALAPNSKTRRSNPGWWAMRIAVSCAWLAADPALTRGQAAAGVEPGDGATVGTFVADGPALGASVAGTTGGGRGTDGAAGGGWGGGGRAPRPRAPGAVVTN